MQEQETGESYSSAMQDIKCVVVGSGAVGKSCFVETYVNKTFPTEWVPSILNHHAVTVRIGGESYNLKLVDTNGLEDYDRLRTLSYPQTDVLLVCFCVVYPWSFVDVKEKWVPEITQNCPGKPFLLVGTMTDLRDDPSTIEKLKRNGQKPITQKRAEKLARNVKAVKYVECSALTQEGLTTVFDEAILAALGHTVPKRKRECLLL